MFLKRSYLLQPLFLFALAGRCRRRRTCRRRYHDHHHLYYSPPDHHAAPSPTAGPKYHENGGGGGGAPGQDNFSDFVSLVCQDGPPGPSRSPKVSVSSYYSPGMYPPPPPMSRPVPLVRSAELATSSPPVSTSTSPGHHPGHHMAGYDIMPPILPPSEHHPPPHDGQSQSQL